MILSEPQKIFHLHFFEHLLFVTKQLNQLFTSDFGRLPCDVSIISCVPRVCVSVCVCLCVLGRCEKCTGHLDQCSLLLMVLFRKLRQRERDREGGEESERESEDDSSGINHLVNKHPSPLQYSGTDVWLSVRVCVRARGWLHLAARHLCVQLLSCPAHWVHF